MIRHALFFTGQLTLKNINKISPFLIAEITNVIIPKPLNVATGNQIINSRYSVLIIFFQCTNH